MDQLELKLTNREILGKEVRFLRRQGITPAHLFGHGIKSLALQCDAAKLQRTLSQAGQTRLISLQINSEKKPRTAMVREVQKDWQTGELVHVDFYQVKMMEKVRVDVPVVLIGEAPAAKLKENTLVQDLKSLTIECFPAKIPASVELDISSLTEPEQAIRVKDIELDKEITLLNDPEMLVAKISTQRAEKVEEEIATEQAVGAPEAAPVHEEEPKEE